MSNTFYYRVLIPGLLLLAAVVIVLSILEGG